MDVAAAYGPSMVESSRLSTSVVAPEERLAYWVDMICATFVQLDAFPLAGREFNGDIQVTELGGLRTSDVVADAQHVLRSANQIARSSDAYCLLSLQMEGEATISQDGRSAVLRPGDLSLYDSTRPYTLHFESRFRQYVFQAPRELLIGRGLDTERSTARAVSGVTGIGAIVSPFLRGLRDHAHSVPADAGAALAAQAMDLIASACRPWSPHLEPESVRSLHRQRVARYISDHFADPDLDVARIAADLHVSVRYVHKLFADTDLTVYRSLIIRRLNAASAVLSDPRMADRTIAQVARDCGFKSTSHFIRLFREQFGRTPSEYRDR